MERGLMGSQRYTSEFNNEAIWQAPDRGCSIPGLAERLGRRAVQMREGVQFG